MVINADINIASCYGKVRFSDLYRKWYSKVYSVLSSNVMARLALPPCEERR